MQNRYIAGELAAVLGGAFSFNVGGTAVKPIPQRYTSIAAANDPGETAIIFDWSPPNLVPKEPQNFLKSGRFFAKLTRLQFPDRSPKTPVKQGAAVFSAPRPQCQNDHFPTVSFACNSTHKMVTFWSQATKLRVFTL
jgi:hypothetical protein